MSIMVGTGRGASLGVLVKNAEALEILEQVDTLVVDKTGTLTEGKPALVSVQATNGFEEKRYCNWQPAWNVPASTRLPRPLSVAQNDAA